MWCVLFFLLHFIEVYVSGSTSNNCYKTDVIVENGVLSKHYNTFIENFI